MKSSWQNISFFLVFLAILMLSCTKDNSHVPDGNIVGYVYTFNEFSELLDDHSGVNITARGESYFQAITDKNGRFELKNVPAGTYQLDIVKKGFGILKQFGIKHLGGEPTVLGIPFQVGTVGSAYFIYNFSTTKITDIKIENDSIKCDLDFINTVPESVRIKVYFSNEEDFELFNGQIVSDYTVMRRGNIYVSKISFYKPPFFTGENVYFRACIIPFYSTRLSIDFNSYITGIYYYYDYDKNIIIYPTLGDESEQFSFIFR